MPHPHDIEAAIAHPVPVPGLTRRGRSPTLGFVTARTPATIRHVPPEALGTATIGNPANPFRYAVHGGRLWMPVPALFPGANGVMPPATHADWLGGLPLPRFRNIKQPAAAQRFQPTIYLRMPPFAALNDWPGLWARDAAPRTDAEPVEDLGPLCADLVRAAATDLIHDGECLYVALERPMLHYESHLGMRHGAQVDLSTPESPAFPPEESRAYRDFLDRQGPWSRYAPEYRARHEADLDEAVAVIGALGLTAVPARDVELYVRSALPAMVDALRSVIREKGAPADEARARMAAAWPWVARASVGGPAGQDLPEALDRVRDLAGFVATRHPAAKARGVAEAVTDYVTLYAAPKLVRLGLTRDAEPEIAEALAALAF